jgi:hypothetical protein
MSFCFRIFDLRLVGVRVSVSPKHGFLSGFYTVYCISAGV